MSFTALYFAIFQHKIRNLYVFLFIMPADYIINAYIFTFLNSHRSRIKICRLKPLFLLRINLLKLNCRTFLVRFNLSAKSETFKFQLSNRRPYCTAHIHSTLVPPPYYPLSLRKEYQHLSSNKINLTYFFFKLTLLIFYLLTFFP